VFIDSHCHINFSDLAPRLPEILANMSASRVTHALCVSVDLESLPSVLAVADAHDNIYASVGVHPDYEDCTEPDVAGLVALADHPSVVAIGETGMDFYRQPGPLPWQEERFRVHIRAARATGKPLIIHTRAASADTLRVMSEENAREAGGVMHCFTETLEMAQAAIEMGFYISFSGIVTFKNAVDIKAVARAVPLERMLIETDSPYLAPVPYRGKTNEPAYVPYVAAEIARLKDLPVEDVARVTTQNFHDLFLSRRH
jgi:TatD DNase family protein